MKTYIVRVFHTQLGGHTHVRILTGHLNLINNASLAYAGKLVMTNEEFAAWKAGTALMQFVENEDKKQEDSDGRSSNQQTGN
jgi:hypothetical protein